MVESVHYTQSSEILCSFSGKTRIIVQWLLSEAVQSVINAHNTNWKLILHGGANKNIRTVIEQYRQILPDS